jgi:hypothetical protein
MWPKKLLKKKKKNPKHVFAHKLKNFEDLNVTQKIIFILKKKLPS